MTEISPSEVVDPINLVIVDQSRDALDAARDQADRRLSEEPVEGSGFRKFINGIWKGNIARDYYRQKYTNQALREIKANQDTLYYESPEDNRSQAKEATINRFLDGREELIHNTAGEKREIQSDNSELVTETKELIRRYCSGELNDETLKEERTRVLDAYRDKHGKDSLGDGVVTVDNMIEVAQAVSGAIENGESIDNVLNNLQVIIGEARTSVRTEARRSAVDKAIDSLSRTKVGSLVGPEVVATAVTTVASILKLGSHSVVGAITKTILPGVAAGAWAGLRENRRTKDEYTQHSRDMAMGKEFDDGATRRSEMEKVRYDSISAVYLTENLRSVIGGEKLDAGGNTALKDALQVLAAVETRIHLSDSRKIDLISFTNPADIGSERMALDIAVAEAKVALNGRLTDDVRKELGFSESASIGDVLKSQSDEFMGIIESDISAKDKAFNKLKARRVAKSVAIGVATGLTIGLLSQEVIAAVDPTRTGLIEQLWGAHNIPSTGDIEHQTVMHGLFAGNETTIHTGPSSEYISHAFGASGEISVSNDHNIVDNGNGTFSLVGANGHVGAENIPINSDGSLPQSSIDQLHKLGMVVNDKSFNIESAAAHTQQVSASDYVMNHPNETTHITRDLWYDNDTTIADRNELRLQWGGNDGINDTGYQLDTSTMAADGSYHGIQSVDWNHAAQGGELKLAISATTDTQNHVFMVDIGPDGKVNIPAGSPAAQFFSNENGHAVFHGAYAEVVQTGNVDANGVEHIRPLATLVGDKKPGLITENVAGIIHHPSYEIITPGYDTIHENFTEMAPVIPVDSRKSLESLIANKLQVPDMSPMYYGGGMEGVHDWLKNNPDRLKTRRRIQNEQGEIVWVEMDGSPVKRNVDSEHSVINDYLNGEGQRDPNYIKLVENITGAMEPMANSCRVAINVPAWMEGSNLGHWLEQFTDQVDKNKNPLSPDMYELNILVNRRTGTEADDSVSVINAFIADYEQKNEVKPRVNYYDIELDPPNNNVGYARKLITDVVLSRSVKRNQQNACLYIESEDADVVRADRQTVINLIDKFDTNPHLDALRGVQDRDPTQLKENDYLFMRRRAWDFFEILARQKRFRDPAKPEWNYTWNRTVTGGWNTGYTAEVYASINGYDSILAGEDMLIGEKISMIRGNGSEPNLETVGTVSTRSDSSPRRFIQEIVQGKGAYEDFMDERANKEIREKSIPELMGMISSHARLSDRNSVDFESYLNAIPHWAKSVTVGSKTEEESMTRRILFMLGFKKDDYSLDGDRIHVSSWENFKDSLNGYRNRFEAVVGQQV